MLVWTLERAGSKVTVVSWFACWIMVLSFRNLKIDFVILRIGFKVLKIVDFVNYFRNSLNFVKDVRISQTSKVIIQSF